MVTMNCKNRQSDVQILITKIRDNPLDSDAKLPTAKNVLSQQIQALKYALLSRINLIEQISSK